MTLVFTVPAPPQELSPNRSRNGHWSKKSEATKAYKELARWTCLSAMRQAGWAVPDKVKVSYLWRMGKRRAPFYRPKDDRNAIGSLKALDDGMVLAGLVADDDRKHWSFGGIDFADGHDEVTVTVEAI